MKQPPALPTTVTPANAAVYPSGRFIVVRSFFVSKLHTERELDADSMVSEKSFGLFTPVAAIRYVLLTEATEKSTPVFGAQKSPSFWNV
jgi:hypothetical protein